MQIRWGQGHVYTEWHPDQSPARLTGFLKSRVCFKDALRGKVPGRGGGAGGQEGEGERGRGGGGRRVQNNGAGVGEGVPSGPAVGGVNGPIRGLGGVDWRNERRGWRKGGKATPMRTRAGRCCTWPKQITPHRGSPKPSHQRQGR